MSNKKMNFLLLLIVFAVYILMLGSCGSSVVDSVKDNINSAVDDKKSDLEEKVYPKIDSMVKKVEIPVIKEGDI